MPRCSFAVVLTLGLVSSLLLGGCIEPPPDLRPTADFVGTPLTGTAPLKVHFTDATTQGGSPVLSWQWKFGDGTFASNPNPVHVYNQPGSYTVSLTVTNAFGTDTRTVGNYVVVDAPTEAGTIGPEGGALNLKGVGVEVPPNALQRDVAFVVTLQDDPIELNTPGTTTLLSETFALTHDNERERVFTLDGEGLVRSSTIRVPFDPAAVPVEDRSDEKIQIIAQLDNGMSFLIFGDIVNNTVAAPVTRFPAQARYAVVYRPNAFDRTRTIAEGKAPTGSDWADTWQVNLSTDMLQQLTALRLGTIGNPSPYALRNFSQFQLNQTEADVLLALEIIQNQLANSGMRSPVLSSRGGAYRLAFFNFVSAYETDYDNFRALAIENRDFGSVLIDPRQLLAVAQHNAAEAIANPFDSEDIKQELGFANIFTQALVRASIAGYDYPDITAPDLDGTPVHFLAAFEEGFSTFLGQELDNLDIARSFGENEKMSLTPPLFYPIYGQTAGYAVGSQDFFRYMDNLFELEGLTDYITSNDLENPGVLEAIRRAFAAKGSEPTFEEALAIAGAAANEAFEGRLGEGLPTIYRDLARDLGAENSTAAMLRPSDADRLLNRLNADRFGEDNVIAQTFAAPTDSIEISFASDSRLIVPPLSTRAVLLEVHPTASEVSLTFNVEDWLEDESGNSVAVAVYRDGFPAVTLPEGADTLVLPDFFADPENCLVPVLVIFSNINLEEAQTVSLTASSFAGLNIEEGEVLDEYVSVCDPNYQYTIEASATIPAFDVTSTVVQMTSGAWRGPGDGNHVNWEHYISIIEPPVITSDVAMLVVAGGSTGTFPGNTPELLIPFSLATGTVVALVQAVPNQPLLFPGENSGRVEDEIIAYSYDEYLTGFENGAPDKAWPALLPMARTAVRAMDTIQDFMTNESAAPAAINRFVVTGASKRGWTTWLSAVADERVAGIIPLVIDVLNMDEQIAHHYRSYGFYSSALQDYVDEDVFSRLDTPQGSSLLSIVDPLSYLERLDMPKLIANSTGDQFFLPDSWKFYFDELPGENRIYYAPNTDHGLTNSSLNGLDEGTLNAMLAWYTAFVRNTARPAFTSGYVDTVPVNPGESGQYRLSSATAPIRVTLWQAESSTRDFRLETIGTAWQSSTIAPVTLGGETTFTATYTAPESGWRAYFMTATYPGPSGGGDVDFEFSTPIIVLPDLYPDEL